MTQALWSLRHMFDQDFVSVDTFIIKNHGQKLENHFMLNLSCVNEVQLCK